MYQQQKRYNTEVDSFSDFKLGMASEAGKAWGWRGSGGLKLQCIYNFHVVEFSLISYQKNCCLLINTDTVVT